LLCKIQSEAGGEAWLYGMLMSYSLTLILNHNHG
jgi:hypothetical protein